MQNKIPIIENKYFENGSVLIEFTFSKIFNEDNKEKINIIDKNLEYHQLYDAIKNFLLKETETIILKEVEKTVIYILILQILFT